MYVQYFTLWGCKMTCITILFGYDVSHVILSPRPSRFSVCSIKKLGRPGDVATTMFECLRILFLQYSLQQCNLDVSKAQVLGQSLKFTSKLHSIE